MSDNVIQSHYHLEKEFDQAGYFKIEEHQQLSEQITQDIQSGKLIALSGIVGSGKSLFMQRLQQHFHQEKKILVCESMAIEKKRVKINTLISAIFYDLSTESNIKIPTHPEHSARKLNDLIHKQDKPVALFFDDAHNLDRNTLIDLKVLTETIKNEGGILSVVLAGHPRLNNDLLNPNLEEIGSRSALYPLKSIEGVEKTFLEWIINECLDDKTQISDIFSSEAIELLALRLSTPLQVIHYLNLAIKAAYQVGTKPITPEIIESTMYRNINDLEPKLIRHGYHVKNLCELLDARPAEIRSLLKGKLNPSRAQELQNEMLAAGIPI